MIMLRKLFEPVLTPRSVAVLGAAGGIGQPLALLLKKSPFVCNLFLHDITDTAGMVVDLSHINTSAKVKGFTGLEQIPDAVQDADIILIAAGISRKPGLSRRDLFETNAMILRDIMLRTALAAPKAFIGVITNPINSTVPLVAGILQKAKVFAYTRLFGVTTLDEVRASTFVAELKNLDPSQVKVPIVGGHCEKTIIPWLSKCSPCLKFTDEEVAVITKKLREAGSKVVEAKSGSGSATLSMAHSAARFTESLCRGLQGEMDVEESVFVYQIAFDTEYFSTPANLNCGGHNVRDWGLGLLAMGHVSDYEERQVHIAANHLRADAKVAEEFLEKYCPTLEEMMKYKRTSSLKRCYVPEEPDFPPLKPPKEADTKSPRINEMKSEEPELKPAVGKFSEHTTWKPSETTGGKIAEKSGDRAIIRSKELENACKSLDHSGVKLFEKDTFKSSEKNTCKSPEQQGKASDSSLLCKPVVGNISKTDKNENKETGCKSPEASDSSPCKEQNGWKTSDACKSVVGNISKADKNESKETGCKPPERMNDRSSGCKPYEKPCKPAEDDDGKPCDQTDVKTFDKVGFTGCNKPADCDK